jgi:hypothetical protein
LACIQTSLLLMAEIERARALRPTPLPAPERPLLGTAALRGDDCKTQLSLIWWDIYPAFPKSIRLGKVEAADECEAIEKSPKRFKQDPAILIVLRRG